MTSKDCLLIYILCIFKISTSCLCINHQTVLGINKESLRTPLPVTPDLKYLPSTEGLGGEVMPVGVLYVGGDPGQQGHRVQDGAVRHAAALGFPE